jgi:hypothetical protein
MTTKDFILKNHESLTVMEMADELKISGPAVSMYCDRLGIKAITKRQKSINYIKENPATPVEELATALKMTPGAVRNLISQNNLRPKPVYVPLQRLKQKVNETNKPPVEIKQEVEEDAPLNVEDDARTNTIKLQKMAGALEVGVRNGVKGFKDKYTHGKSPLGIASELHGI